MMSSSGGDGGFTSTLSNGWNVEFRPLSSSDYHQHHHNNNNGVSAPSTANHGNNRSSEGIIVASIPLSTLYAQDGDAYRAFVSQATEEKEAAEAGDCNTTAAAAAAAAVALADYAARSLSNLLPMTSSTTSEDSSTTIIQTMGQQAKFHNGTSSSSSSSSSLANHEKRQWRRNKIMAGRRQKKEVPIPYVLERTDCMVLRGQGANNTTIVLQLFLHTTYTTPRLLDGMLVGLLDRLQIQLTSFECYAHVACVVLQRVLRSRLQPPRNNNGNNNNNNEETRNEKIDEQSNKNKTPPRYLNAVAFIADGSLLPRKSGRSMLPMPSPPAVPFASPGGSEQLTRVVTVDVGPFWRRYLNNDGSVAVVAPRTTDTSGDSLDGEAATTVMMDTSTTTENAKSASTPPTTVTMRGMIIPQGVTLIVGGGYHGKSTILQALCMGVYDNLPNDGRERVVTHIDAVSIRAEDGRYVHNTNVSAFISNLPSGKSINGASVSCTKQDTTRFGTKDASGSTSQAANVIEALECGASTLLVDEDVSAANFMARDGRMRAMIMDEPITPLLYRVNGLFLSPQHRVSTVVVVGGVGEWLDVADAVVLMKDYAAYDGLKKAQSVSYQFSYGHVQYAGRGVVHRLPWEVKEDNMMMMKKKNLMAKESNGNGDGDGDDMTDENEDEKATTLSPLRRRPESNCISKKFNDAAVHLLESGSARLWFYPDQDIGGAAAVGCDNGNAAATDDDDEDDGMVDMSKCSQLVGNASEQLYGCGICCLWLIQESQRHPQEDLSDLLDRMERVLNHSGGMNELVASLKRGQAETSSDDNNMLSQLLASHDVLDLWETVGFAYRPRRHEVAMALTRMRGMRFDILPEKPKEVMDTMESTEEEAKRLEEESKKRALAELWANRRKK